MASHEKQILRISCTSLVRGAAPDEIYLTFPPSKLRICQNELPADGMMGGMRLNGAHLSKHQGVVDSVGHLSSRPPVVQLGIYRLLEQSALESTSGKLSPDGGVDSVA